VGEFSRRGGIIDFFSPLHENPVAAEFSGDAIEVTAGLSIPRPSGPPERSGKRCAAGRCGSSLSLTRGLNGLKKRLPFEFGCALPIIAEQYREIEQGCPPSGGEFLAPFFYEIGKACPLSAHKQHRSP